MPRYGFSGSPADMRKLLLCILRAGPADGRELLWLSLLDDNADYFLFSDALDGIFSAGLAVRDGERAALTPKGREVADIVERELPAALRRAVAEAFAAARDRQFWHDCITAEVEEADGLVYFSGVLTDGRAPLLSLRLQAGSVKQAAALKRRFEKGAEGVFRDIWEMMTMTDNNEQITDNG